MSEPIDQATQTLRGRVAVVVNGYGRIELEVIRQLRVSPTRCMELTFLCSWKGFRRFYHSWMSRRRFLLAHSARTSKLFVFQQVNGSLDAKLHPTSLLLLQMGVDGGQHPPRFLLFTIRQIIWISTQVKHQILRSFHLSIR